MQALQAPRETQSAPRVVVALMQVLQTADPKQKAVLTHQAWQQYRAGLIQIGSAEAPARPSRPEKPQVSVVAFTQMTCLSGKTLDSRRFCLFESTAIHNNSCCRADVPLKWLSPFVRLMQNTVTAVSQHCLHLCCSWSHQKRCQRPSNHPCRYQYTCKLMLFVWCSIFRKALHK